MLLNKKGNISDLPFILKAMFTVGFIMTIVLLINTSNCLSGIDTRTEIFGKIYPEHGISGLIAFTTPSSFVDTIIDLQP